TVEARRARALAERLAHLLDADPRHRDRRLCRALASRRRDLRAGVGDVQGPPGARRLRPGHRPAVGRRSPESGIRRVAARSVRCARDAGLAVARGARRAAHRAGLTARLTDALTDGLPIAPTAFALLVTRA